MPYRARASATRSGSERVHEPSHPKQKKTQGSTLGCVLPHVYLRSRRLHATTAIRTIRINTNQNNYPTEGQNSTRYPHPAPSFEPQPSPINQPSILDEQPTPDRGARNVPPMNTVYIMKAKQHTAHVFMLSTSASEAARRTVSASALPRGATAEDTAFSTRARYANACTHNAYVKPTRRHTRTHVPPRRVLWLLNRHEAGQRGSCWFSRH